VAAVLWTENFAYATGRNESKQHYLGQKAGEHIIKDLSVTLPLVAGSLVLALQETEWGVFTEFAQHDNNLSFTSICPSILPP
jgi:hypothetical protein